MKDVSAEDLAEAIESGAGLRTDHGSRAAVGLEDLQNAIALIRSTQGFAAEICTVNCKGTSSPVIVILVGMETDVPVTKRLFAAAEQDNPRTRFY